VTRAKLTYARAVAVTACHSINSPHQRAACLARARKLTT
jgi:hypothetical protein